MNDFKNEQVSDFTSWRFYSLNKLSKMSGHTRDTVQRRLDDANVQPTAVQAGFPVYDLWEAAKAILTPQAFNLDYSDPEKLPAKERKDWYEGTKAKLAVEKEQGELLAYADAKQTVADIIKPALQLLDSIPDNLERDYNLPPKIIADIEKRFDDLRNHWADELEKL
jgi:hypothetical protein